MVFRGRHTRSQGSHMLCRWKTLLRIGTGCRTAHRASTAATRTICSALHSIAVGARVAKDLPFKTPSQLEAVAKAGRKQMENQGLEVVGGKLSQAGARRWSPEWAPSAVAASSLTPGTRA